MSTAKAAASGRSVAGMRALPFDGDDVGFAAADRSGYGFLLAQSLSASGTYWARSLLARGTDWSRSQVRGFSAALEHAAREPGGQSGVRPTLDAWL